MKYAGRILKHYSRVIAECIPLFVTAGLLSVLSAVIFQNRYLPEMSNILSFLVIPVFMGYKAGTMCGGDVGCASAERIGLRFDVRICRLLSCGLRDLNESRIRHTPGLITDRFKIRYENEKQESTALRHAIWRHGQK